MTTLYISETAEYQLEQSEGESLADVYQRFLDNPSIYLTAVTDRTFEVWGDGMPYKHRPLTPMEELAFKGVEDRS